MKLIIYTYMCLSVYVRHTNLKNGAITIVLITHDTYKLVKHCWGKTPLAQRIVGVTLNNNVKTTNTSE